MVNKTTAKSRGLPLKLKRANPYPAREVDAICNILDPSEIEIVFSIGFIRLISKIAVLKLSNVGVLGNHTTVISKKSDGERNAMLTIYSNGYKMMKEMQIKKTHRKTFEAHCPK